MLKYLLTSLLLFLTIALFAQQGGKQTIPYDTLWAHYEKCDKTQILSANKRLNVLEKRALEVNDTVKYFRVVYERSVLNTDNYGKWYAKDLIQYFDTMRKKPIFINSAYEGIMDYLICKCLEGCKSSWYRDNSTIGLRDFNLLEQWSNVDLHTVALQYLDEALALLGTINNPTPTQCSFLFNNAYKEYLYPSHLRLYDVLFLDYINYSNISKDEAIPLINRVLIDCQDIEDPNIIIDYEILLAATEHGDITLPLEANPYWQALLNIEKKYGTNDAIAYNKGVAAYHAFHKEPINNPSPLGQQALSYFEQVLNMSTCPYYRTNAAHYKENIECATLKFTSRNKEFMPASKISIPISYKNIDTLYVSIYKTKEEINVKKTFYKEDVKPNYVQRIYLLEDNFSNLRSTKFISRQQFILHKSEKNTQYTTDLWLDSLSTGHYILLFHRTPDWDYLNVIAAENINVTDIQVSTYKFIQDKYFLLATNRRTGEPLKHKNVKVGFLNYKLTNKNGLCKYASYYYDKYITVHNGRKDCLYSSYSYTHDGLITPWRYTKRSNPNYSEIITDRTLYRPGQTVYFKSIILRDDKPAANWHIVFNLYDNHYHKIDSLALETNEFGSASGSFILPNNSNGTFRIRSWEGSKSFQVAAYKLPSFSVNFEEDTAATCQGDTLHIRGKALSLAGTPISGADVALHITVNNQNLRTIHAECDNEGHFDCPYLTAKLTEEQDNYILQVEAVVTDVNGEAQMATKDYIIPEKPFRFDFVGGESADIATTNNTPWIISVRNATNKALDIPITVTITRLQHPKQYLEYYYQDFPIASCPQQTADEYARTFPGYSFESNILDQATWPVLDTLFHTCKSFKGDSLLPLSIQQWPTGSYCVKIAATDDHGRTDTMTKFFDIFRSDVAHSDRFSPIWVELPHTTAIGDTLPVVVGTCLPNTVLICDIFQGRKRLSTIQMPLSEEQQTLLIPTRKKGHHQINIIAHISKNNHVYSASNQIQLLHEPLPEIQYNSIDLKLTHWNSTLEPGSEEFWEMELNDLTTPEDKEMEMLTWMIDGSLFKLGMSNFKYNFLPTFTVPKIKYKQKDITGILTSHTIVNRTYPYLKGQFYEYPLIEKSNYAIVEPSHRFRPDHTSSYSGRRVSSDNLRTTPGRSVTSALAELDGVNSIDGSMTSVRGNRSDGQQYIVDGVRINESTTQIKYEPPVFTLGVGDEESAPAPIRKPSQELAANQFQFSSNIRMRSDFTETAFFYPQLRTDSTGHIKFRFTVPDQYTEWKFYALAHNKTHHTGWLEETFRSQRSMMIQGNAPRFLREGDTLTLQIKISSLCDTVLNGKSTVRFFNFATGEPINILINAGDSLQDFRCDAKGTTSVQWLCTVPQGLEAISYRVLAQAGNYGDGEERAIPVLPNRTLLTESMHFTVPAKSDTTMTFKRFANQTSNTIENYSYTMEITTNPMWFAIQSLPYLIKSKYECNEQIFTRLYANAIALHIVKTYPDIEQMYEKWRNDTANESLISPLLKNENLKGILLEETPWVWQAQRESQQRVDMANLFEQNRLQGQIDRQLRRLLNRQLVRGGWDWYGCWSLSSFTTNRIVAGYRKLQKLGIDIPEASATMQLAIAAMDRTEARKYEEYLEAYAKDHHTYFYFSETDVQYLYARSFGSIDTLWLAQPYVQNLMKLATQNIQYANYTRRAEVALILYRTGKVQQAQDLMEAIRQQAYVSRELGMYWKSDYAGRRGCYYYPWYEAPIERQALLIEAFNEISPKEDELQAMKQWLLSQKQSNAWANSTATADAIYALLLNQGEEALHNPSTTITVGEQEFIPAEDSTAEAGTGYLKHVWKQAEITPELATVSLQTDSTSMAFGACYWQYFENLDKVTNANEGLTIERALYHYTDADASKVLEPVTDSNPVKLGEKICVRIAVTCDRDLEYVHIKDLRAAAFEPANIFETFKYLQGIRYCESPTDAATNFFFSSLPKGTYVIEYDLIATQSGSFSEGIATIECLYAPEFRAQSNGGRVLIGR